MTAPESTIDRRAEQRRRAAAIAVALALVERSEFAPAFNPLPPPTEAWRSLSFARSLPSADHFRTLPAFPRNA